MTYEMSFTNLENQISHTTQVFIQGVPYVLVHFPITKIVQLINTLQTQHLISCKFMFCRLFNSLKYSNSTGMPGVAYDLYLKECPEGNSNFLSINILKGQEIYWNKQFLQLSYPKKSYFQVLNYYQIRNNSAWSRVGLGGKKTLLFVQFFSIDTPFLMFQWTFFC